MREEFLFPSKFLFLHFELKLIINNLIKKLIFWKVIMLWIKNIIILWSFASIIYSCISADCFYPVLGLLIEYRVVRSKIIFY